MVDPTPLFNVPLRGEKYYTLGSVNGASYAYELLYILITRDNPEEEIRKEVAKLTSDPISIDELPSYLYNQPEFGKYKKIHMEALDQARRIMNNTFSSIVCRKCKSNKVLSNTIQQRGLDEPATTYIKCLKCGANYKQEE